MAGERSGGKAQFLLGTRGVIPTLLVILLTGVAIRYFDPTGEALKSWGEYLTGAGTLGLLVGAFYAAKTALREYQLNRQADEGRSKLEKAKWLSELFKSFYEGGKYKKIRRKIDFEDIQEIVGLIGKDGKSDAQFSETERELFDEFSDYLNLFEFVAYLNKLNQLDSEDIKALFAYYLERLVQVDTDGGIRRYLEANGYGNLSRVLKGYEV